MYCYPDELMFGLVVVNLAGGVCCSCPANAVHECVARRAGQPLALFSYSVAAVRPHCGYLVAAVGLLCGCLVAATLCTFCGAAVKWAG